MEIAVELGRVGRRLRAEPADHAEADIEVAQL